MSQDSPRETEELDPPPQSPDDHEPLQQESEMSRTDDPGDHGLGYDFEVKEQDRWLPIANVARIMKMALPENAKIAKEAKECMQECVSEFISFITSEASEKCQQEKRKTVNGEDILFAMTSLGFENYGEALKIYLARYRENLVARGEHQKPAGTGSGGIPTTSPAYDPSNHAALGNPMDPSESGADFGYSTAHVVPGDRDFLKSKAKSREYGLSAVSRRGSSSDDAEHEHVDDAGDWTPVTESAAVVTSCERPTAVDQLPEYSVAILPSRWPTFKYHIPRPQ
ncbi:hypothetical protein B0A55_00022 [Friedmanniomyces simplex]|uniref:Transcription factor CBF/NF-Y/archaeal histone domain-containing protein n=1 Tax=Friedmanniomyces simplex TaxID=329884 RepID=A0A4U0Y2U2_9PEZI|nr:hypothetical protein B0A55_00022 [Friedmanniomyces simplex]